MKRLVLSGLCALFLATPAQAERLRMPIEWVADGDTLATRFPSLPAVLQRVYIRVAGIDTPEKGDLARCQRERILAEKATELTRALVKQAWVIEVEPTGWDKYGGRFDGFVYLDGKSLGETLLAHGVALPYDGGRKPDWCKS
jgi:endonuclease YncB( thermonuclease family)